MNAGEHFLHPFPSPGQPTALRLAVRIVRRARLLAIGYELQGDLADLVIPARSGAPARKHGLWEQTCFEFFLAAPHSPRYREFNLSPAGDWNVYRFTAYRDGMREEEGFGSLPFNTRLRPDSLSIDLEFCPEPVFDAGGPLEVAVSAVIRHADGGTSWWALIHPGPQPDFHHREGFIIRV
jgi:hypothetical protein